MDTKYINDNVASRPSQIKIAQIGNKMTKIIFILGIKSFCSNQYQQGTDQLLDSDC